MKSSRSARPAYFCPSLPRCKFDLQIRSKCDERGRSWTPARPSSSRSCDTGSAHKFWPLSRAMHDYNSRSRCVCACACVCARARVRPSWGRKQRSCASAAAVAGMQSPCLALFSTVLIQEEEYLQWETGVFEPGAQLPFACLACSHRPGQHLADLRCT